MTIGLDDFFFLAECLSAMNSALGSTFGQPSVNPFRFIFSFIKTKPKRFMSSTFLDGQQNLGWTNILLPTGRTSFAHLSSQFASPSDWNQLEAGTLSGPEVCDRGTCPRLLSGISATGLPAADSSLQTRTVSGSNHRQDTSV